MKSVCNEFSKLFLSLFFAKLFISLFGKLLVLSLYLIFFFLDIEFQVKVFFFFQYFEDISPLPLLYSFFFFKPLKS